MLKSLLALLLLVTLTTGCAFTKTKTQIDFQPSVAHSLARPAKTSLAVADFKDSRPVQDKTFLVHKKNGYGQTTSGAFVAQKPIAEIFRDGVVDSLKKNQFDVTPEAGKYQLQAEIQDFDFDVITGFWKAEVKPKFQVRFELREKNAVDPVWRDTFIGRSSVETAWGTKETIVSMFKLAAEDAVRQLIADESFRRLFQVTE